MYPYEFTESVTEWWLRFYIARPAMRCKWWLHPLGVAVAIVAYVAILVFMLGGYFLFGVSAAVILLIVMLMFFGTFRAEQCHRAYCRYQEAKRLYEQTLARHAEQKQRAGNVEAEDMMMRRRFAAIVVREFGEGDFPTFERPSD